MRLAMGFDEVTKDWLERALTERWPGITVKSLDYDTISHGAATRARLSFEYDWRGNSTPPPNTMWLKTGFEAHHDFAMPNYTVEVDFYRKIRPHIPIRSPECFFAEVQTDPPQATLILEDLKKKGVTFAVPMKPMTLDQVSSGLEQLAILHSQPLDTPHMADLKPIEMVRYATEERGTRPERFFKWPRVYAAPVCLHNADRIRAGFDVYWKMIFGGPHSLLHGDTHVGNSYIEPDNSVSFLDWQGYGTGYWMHDVPYFVIGALDLPDRQKSERDLLKFYMAKREALGQKMPSFEDAWEDWRRAVYFGFITWIGNEDTWQLPETNLAQFARFSAAMMEHDTFNALGV